MRERRGAACARWQCSQCVPIHLPLKLLNLSGTPRLGAV
jgi:hypothetical protein